MYISDFLWKSLFELLSERTDIYMYSQECKKQTIPWAGTDECSQVSGPIFNWDQS